MPPDCVAQQGVSEAPCWHSPLVVHGEAQALFPAPSIAQNIGDVQPQLEPQGLSQQTPPAQA
jgi:hypothetical protein